MSAVVEEVLRSLIWGKVLIQQSENTNKYDKESIISILLKYQK